MNRKNLLNLLFFFVVFLLSQFLMRGPDFIRAKTTPVGKWYTGQASWFDPWDLNVYFSAIGWGKRDGILFLNLYDTESIQSMPIYSLYTLMGKAASPLGWANPLVFHLGGIAASFFLAAVIYWFLKIFLKNGGRNVSFLILLLGGGLGWLFFPKTVLPDLGQPGFTLASGLRRPHEAVSLGLFLLALGLFYKAIIEKKNHFLFFGSLASLIMLVFHPYSLLSLAVIILGFGFYRWFKTNSLEFWPVLVSLGLVSVIYFLTIGKDLLSNPGFSGLASQVQHSPSPFQAILGWGILFPLILLAFLAKENQAEQAFLQIWFVAGWLIIYLPFGFQKLLIRGLWIPAVILAVLGAQEFCRRARWNYYLVIILLLVFTSLTTFFVFLKTIGESPENRWIYLTKEEGEVIDYLKTYGKNEEGVLASYRLANVIPANTNKRVYAGHTFQTPDFMKRLSEVQNFLAGQMPEEDARNFLNRSHISYLFWGPEEKAISGLKTVPAKTLLEPVLEDEIASLYRVKTK